jgi:hypothetical protein
MRNNICLCAIYEIIFLIPIAAVKYRTGKRRNEKNSNLSLSLSFALFYYAR